MDYSLEFERPIYELENKISKLREAVDGPNVDLSPEIKALQVKTNELIKEIYKDLTPWERVQLSRHPLRPHTIDYINHVFTDFHELAGDRYFSNDLSLICGFGYLGESRVAVVGIEKGRKTKEKVERNFGMPRPEGYRKALRIMELAGQFGIPVVTLIDTPGAYPGIGAEERGQSQAIAENLARMFDIQVPILSLVIGEGGSGGALGIGVSDVVLMMEYSIYSVISPESCASILWSNPKMAETAANSLKLGPGKAIELGVIDGIINEPIGGAHRNTKESYRLVKRELRKEIDSLLRIPHHDLLKRRYEKFRKMGNLTLAALEGPRVEKPVVSNDKGN